MDSSGKRAAPRTEKSSFALQRQLHELLIGACREGNKEAVLFLLDSGANPFLQIPSEFDGETALIGAAKNGHADAVAICCYHVDWISSRAEVVAQTDNSGLTAVHWAIRMQHVACLSVFLQLFPELLEGVEQIANNSATPSIILTSPSFKSFVSMHYPRHVGILRVAPKRLKSSQMHGKMDPPVHSSLSGAAAFERFVKTWCCSCASWLRLENSLIVYAPYACFSSLFIGFLFSVLFASHSEMWFPANTMTPLHFINFAGQGLLWFFISKARSQGAGKVDSGNAYDILLFKVVETTRVGVMQAALAAEADSQDGAKVGVATPRPSACCHICRTWKKPHEGHSPITHRCIPDYDHYCVYLGHEIGRENYPFFFYALGLMATVNLPVFLSLTFTFIRHGLVAPATEKAFSQIWLMTINVFLGWAILSECQMLAFFIFHTYATSVGLTTREVSKRRKQPKCEADGSGSGGKSPRIWQNWSRRLGWAQTDYRTGGQDRDRSV